MQDISLHLLDILENSVRAGARNIKVRVINNVLKNRLRIIVEDDGSGMDAHTLEKAQDPFYTSKEERVKKVGLGIPLFKQNAEIVGGSFKMASEPGFGTVLTVDFPLDHIDRMPLGNLKDTLLGGIIGHPEVDSLSLQGQSQRALFSFRYQSYSGRTGRHPSHLSRCHRIHRPIFI